MVKALAHEQEKQQRLLTEADVSAITQLSRDTLRTMRCRRVGIPYTKLGASVPRWTLKSGHQWTPENRPPRLAR